MRSDRDEIRAETENYLTNQGMMKYHAEFSRLAQERFDSYVYRLGQCCDYFNVASTRDPRFRVLSDVIESAYPTYSDILIVLLEEREVKFPTGSDIKERIKKLLRCDHFNSL